MNYQLHDFAELFGATLSGRSASATFHYDGKTIAMQYDNDKRIGNTRILHEILHFAVATNEQRLLPNFGLGPSSYDNHQLKAPVTISNDEIKTQELLVVMLTKYCKDVLNCEYQISDVHLDRWLKNHSELVFANLGRFTNIIIK